MILSTESRIGHGILKTSYMLTGNHAMAISPGWTTSSCLLYTFEYKETQSVIDCIIALLYIFKETHNSILGAMSHIENEEQCVWLLHYQHTPGHSTRHQLRNFIVNWPRVIKISVIPSPVENAVPVLAPHTSIVGPEMEVLLRIRQVDRVKRLSDWINNIHTHPVGRLRVNVLISAGKINEPSAGVHDSANTGMFCVFELDSTPFLPAVVLDVVLPRRVGSVDMKSEEGLLVRRKHRCILRLNRAFSKLCPCWRGIVPWNSEIQGYGLFVRIVDISHLAFTTCDIELVEGAGKCCNINRSCI